MALAFTPKQHLLSQDFVHLVKLLAFYSIQEKIKAINLLASIPILLVLL